VRGSASLPETGDNLPDIAFKDVGFSYPGRDDNPSLSEINLEIKPGEFVCLAGLNGSGKSTMCHLINALLLPARGKVITCGLDTLLEQNLYEVRRCASLIMQNPDNQIVGPTVEDDVAFGPENLGLARDEIEKRVEDALRVMELEGLRSREPHLLSMGEKKRLAIAGALAMQPRILVSDESTCMLDPEIRAETLDLFLRLRDERGITIIHASHRADELMLSDRVVLLESGRIIFDGSPEDLFTRPQFASGHGLRPPGLFEIARELERMGFPMPRKPLHTREVVESLWACN
jgi:energy-coupling factor transport system ATP-binding protein